MPNRWIVAWDFSHPPKHTFYNVFKDEFGPTEAEHIQRSVVVCRDDFVARRLRALARWYGADVVAYSVNGDALDDAKADREAEEFVTRVQSQRLLRRGRKSNSSKLQ